MPIKVGDPIPSVEVMEETPANKVNVAQLFEGKKGILLAVPGAFTPGCSKAKGVEVIACISINDPFVMTAWGQASGATDKIRMLADTHGLFTKVNLAAILFR
ncbi:hypothetical protein QZH41_006944 [Actinostola sp. cb2023]|nr:hypothetical protein QZH41_006944 [Actinostola sp. cb2023]